MQLRLKHLAAGILVAALPALSGAGAQGEADRSAAAPVGAAELERTFQEDVRPLLARYCVRCHNAEEMKSGIRVDLLDDTLDDRRLFLLKELHEQLSDGAMPPAGG
jgi:hypothetical protein